MKKLQKGFTLIELLVVIAIIGILSSIVLASLSSARSKGTDAAITSTLSNMRAQAELYYANNNNYGPAATLGNCPTTAANTNIFSSSTTGGMWTLVSDLNTKAGNTAGNTQCVNVGGNTWAVSAKLATTNSVACADSAGTSKSINASTTATVANVINGTTGQCN